MVCGLQGLFSCFFVFPCFLVPVSPCVSVYLHISRWISPFKDYFARQANILFNNYPRLEWGLGDAEGDRGVRISGRVVRRIGVGTPY